MKKVKREEVKKEEMLNKPVQSVREIKTSEAFKIIVATLIVIIFVFGGYMIFFKCKVTGANPMPQLKAGAEAEITKFARLYLGFTNVSVEGKEFKNGEWRFNVSAKGLSAFENFEIRTDENLNLSSFQVLGKISVPSKPPTYQELYTLNCKDNKSVIDLFVDPYDPWTQRYFDMTNALADKFSESAIKRFHVVNPYTSKLEGYKWAVIASQYLECAKKDSDIVFINTTICIFNKLNENNNTILNETELDICISSAGLAMDNESLRKCLDNESVQLLTQDGEYTLKQLGDISTSYVLIDCKYETFSMYMDVVMCHLYPDYPACKEVR